LSVSENNNKNKWYVGGLHFECMRCGRCCAGPGEGYIWVTSPEIELVADFLKISVEQLREKYLKRIGMRTTIIEQAGTKDCIFLQRIDDKKRCIIYPVRPSQCRIWPFWPENLASTNTWNKAAQKCAGINRGRHYSFEEIEEIRKQKWWQKAGQTISFWNK
jgi:Fe-S-cluster containining protein